MCSRLPPPGLSTSPPMSPSRWHARGLVQDDSYRGVPKGRALPNIGHYFPVPGRRVALLPPVADVARSVLGGKDHGTTGPCENRRPEPAGRCRHYFPVPLRRVGLLPPVAEVARKVLVGNDYGTAGPCDRDHFSTVLDPTTVASSLI